MTRRTRGAAAAGPLQIEIDVGVEAGEWGEVAPLAALVERCAHAVVADLGLVGEDVTELSVIFTDDASIKALNAQWRGKDKATNVLSFPAFPDSGDTIPPMLGDIVIARETLERESALEGKPFEHHLTHLVVHGLLHLLGFDHEDEDEAETMEQRERSVLAALAIPDPYAVTDRDH